jgi:hypothetical protein
MTCAHTWLPLLLSSVGSITDLIGQDVMLYSARTAPDYRCLDAHWGGPGTVAVMWSCDEANANHRYSVTQSILPEAEGPLACHVGLPAPAVHVDDACGYVFHQVKSYIIRTAQVCMPLLWLMQIGQS